MTPFQSRDTLKTLDTLIVGDCSYAYYSLKAAEQTLGDLSHLPCSARILLENLLRHEDGLSFSVEDMRSLSAFHALKKSPPPLSFRPSRILLGGNEAISILVDMARIRDVLAEKGADPLLLSPDCPADIVTERPSDFSPEDEQTLSFLKWSERAFPSLRVAPPGKGRGGALNIGFLTSVVREQPARDEGLSLVFPDSVWGTNRHLSAIGGLGTISFALDALDIEAAFLGSYAPLSFSGVLGVKLTGRPSKKVGATDMALAILKAVRQAKGAGKIVEFLGPGLDHLSVFDRAAIADILIETDALSVLFPIDQAVLAHLETRGGAQSHLALVEAYAKVQGLWRESGSKNDASDPAFTSVVEFNLEAVEPCLGGPGLAYNPTPLEETAKNFLSSFPPPTKPDPLALVRHGDVLSAAIGPFGTALHPMEMIAAGLVARKARERGLVVKPWVRASLSVPCPVVSDLLRETGLEADLAAIGFVCPKENHPPSLREGVAEAIGKTKETFCALSTGIAEENAPLHPSCGAGYLARPALLVAYALSGSVLKNPLDKTGSEELQDILPLRADMEALLEVHNLTSFYQKEKDSLFEGAGPWLDLHADGGPLFSWKEGSSFIKKPSLFDDVQAQPRALADVEAARALAVWGDDVLAAHISPHGLIGESSAAGVHLIASGETAASLGSFAARAGNEDIMTKGGFWGPSLVNALAPGAPPDLTLHAPSGASLPIFEAAARYKREKTPLFVAAGKNFGTGARQEWAAKILRLLGVSIVVAESFAPSFRLNLIRTGLLPLQIKQGVTLADLGLKGQETASFAGISEFLRPPAEVMITVDHTDTVERYILRARLDTEEEMEMWRHGSLWAESLRNLIMLAG